MFVFRYVPDLASSSKTPKCSIRLKTVESGDLAGEQFFIADTNDLRNEKAEPVPHGLSTVDFLKLDANNVNELLDFQNRYGQIGSVTWRFEHGRKYFRFPGASCLSKNKHSLFGKEERAVGVSLAIFKHLINDIESAIIPHSVKEVKAAVETLQLLISSTIRFKNETKPSMQREFDETFANNFMDLANCIVHEYYPACELIDPEKEYRRTRIPLIDALIIDQISELSSSEPYKRCKCCGCIFQHKVNSKSSHSGEKRRSRSDAEYCSDDCQERAKWERQNERRRTKKETGNGKR